MKRIAIALALLTGAALPCLSAADGTLNFVSQPGDYIGGGATVTRPFTDAQVNVSVSAQGLSINSSVSPHWSLQFGAQPATLAPGCFERADRFGSNTRPQLDFSYGGRGCNTSLGRFKVLELSTSAGIVTSAAIDFVQHCSGSGDALFGKLRYNSNVPVDTPDLAKVFTTTGTLSFVSDSGDYIGQGQTHSYPLDETNFSSANHSGGTRGLVMSYFPDTPPGTWWTLNFAAPTGTVLVPGVYLDARRYPFQPAAQPGLDFSGSGRGCNQLSGEFTIAELARERIDGRPERVDAVFEQHCEHMVPALRGSIDFTTTFTNGELVDDVLFLDGLENAAGTRWPLAWNCPLN